MTNTEQQIEFNNKLFEACENKDIEAAKQAIEAGADVNAKNKYGWTALICACCYNSLEVAQLLIEKDADVNAKDKYEWTPLIVASWKNSLEVAKLLIEKGADVNARDKDGETALYYCQTQEMEDLIQSAIQHEGELK